MIDSFLNYFSIYISIYFLFQIVLNFLISMTKRKRNFINLILKKRRNEEKFNRLKIEEQLISIRRFIHKGLVQRSISIIHDTATTCSTANVIWSTVQWRHRSNENPLSPSVSKRKNDIYERNVQPIHSKGNDYKIYYNVLFLYSNSIFIFDNRRE